MTVSVNHTTQAKVQLHGITMVTTFILSWQEIPKMARQENLILELFHVDKVDKPGTIEYYCQIHPFVRGSITFH